MNQIWKLNRLVRIGLANTVYIMIGLRIRYWREELERIWCLSDFEFRKYQNGTLNSVRPLDGGGSPVSSLQDLSRSTALTKKELKNRGAIKTSSGHLFKRSTSGTTGSRLEVNLNKQELSRLLAVRDYCFRFFGIKLGFREARLWGSKSQTISSQIKDWVLHRKTFHIKSDNLARTVERILDWQPEYIYGYSSYIFYLSSYLAEKKIKIESVKLVVCTAEEISPAQKIAIRNAFNSRVVEEYGSTEFDIIAFEDLSGNLRIVNPWLVVESKDDSLLITDIMRITQSFVRYEIGDSAEIGCLEPCGIGGRLIVKGLRGRSINQYAYGANRTRFHSVAFARAINEYFYENKDSFDFNITQESYGQFDIQLSLEPKLGFDYFNAWLSNYIYREENIEARISSKLNNDLCNFNNKRSYFTQRINSD